MPNMKSNDVLTIAGQRGYGKTTLGKMIALQCKKVIIYDPMFDFSNVKVIKVNSIKAIGNLDRVVFQPIENTEKVFEEFCSFVWNNRKNTMVIIDEADEHATSTKLPPNFGKLVRLGRHKGLGYTGITRRIANYNKTPPALSHHIISFKQTLPNDIEFLESYIGKENAQKLRGLEYFEYLWYDWKTATLGKTKKM